MFSGGSFLETSTFWTRHSNRPLEMNMDWSFSLWKIMLKMTFIPLRCSRPWGPSKLFREERRIRVLTWFSVMTCSRVSFSRLEQKNKELIKMTIN